MIKNRNHDYHLVNEKREPSVASRQSASNKFLKRKPDHKKMIEGLGSKRKRSIQKNEYFKEEILSDQGIEVESLSEYKSQSGKYISSRPQGQKQSKDGNQYKIKKLQTVRSERNLSFRTRQEDKTFGNMMKKNKEQRSIQKNIKQKVEYLSNQEDFEANQSLSGLSYYIYNHKGSPKKSKTEYFIQEQMQLSQLNSQLSKTEDAYQLSNSKDQTRKSKKTIAECQSLTKKTKLFQKQIDMLMEKEHLIQTQNKHLGEMIKEKDKVIDRLTRQKILLNSRIQNKSESDIEKSLERVLLELKNEQQRIVYLKQQNIFLSSELMSRTQQANKVETMYRQLQLSYRRYQRQMIQKVQNMKTQIQRERQKLKSQIVEFDSYGQIQKCKQKVYTQQEELKYLRIQNQCLLVSKEQLQKSIQQNRKLKEERDYFKKKVMEKVNRGRQMTRHDTSTSNASILFELSEMSIEQ